MRAPCPYYKIKETGTAVSDTGDATFELIL